MIPLTFQVTHELRKKYGLQNKILLCLKLLYLPLTSEIF